MPTTMPPTEPPPREPLTPVAVKLQNHSWEAYSVIVATLVGLMSLAVSAYTAYTLHVQTRAQVFPYLQVVTLGSEHRFGVYNKGVGPAFVKSVKVVLDGKPMLDWRQFFNAAGLTLKGQFAYSNVNHVPIAANETLPAMIFTDVEDFQAFGLIDPKRYRIDLCYCSVLDECWAVKVAADDEPPEPQHVGACPIDRATDFTQ